MTEVENRRPLARRLLETPIDALMKRLQWDHNALYHDWILDRLPAEVDEALDVGCGTGEMARRLASRARHVDAVDSSPEMVRLARAATPPGVAVTFEVADITDHPLPAGRYDAITCLAVLHHVPFAATLRTLAAALRPGGVLVVLGTHLEESMTDKARSIAAVPANIAVGAARGIRRIAAGPSWRTVQEVFGTDRPVAMTAPVAPPAMTLARIRAQTAELLPGAVIERRLFWRYSLVYRESD